MQLRATGRRQFLGGRLDTLKGRLVLAAAVLALLLGGVAMEQAGERFLRVDTALGLAPAISMTGQGDRTVPPPLDPQAASKAEGAAAQVSSPGIATKAEARPLAPEAFYQIVSNQIVSTLQDYSKIAVAMPAADPLGKSVSSAQPPKIAGIRVPYWINDDNGEAQQTRAVSKASELLQKLFKQLPIAVRQGKGTPDQIRAAVEAVLATGVVRSAKGDWPPSPADIEAWMGRFGIGLDCSGFVYQALTRIDRGLAAAGQTGLLKPLGPLATYEGSKEIMEGGTRIQSPADLRPGDVMYFPPEAGGGTAHIRIISAVEPLEKGVKFQTAESTAVGLPGPTAQWWRFQDSSSFNNPEQYVDGRWRPAEKWDQHDIFARRLATVGTGLVARP